MVADTLDSALNSNRWGALKARLPSAWGNAVAVGAGWLLLVVITGLWRPDFLSHQTVLAVSFTMAIVGVLAVGQALIGVSGAFIDLSQPACMVLVAYVVTKLLEAGVYGPLIIVVALLVGAAWGLLNALIIVGGKLNPIIVTLATNFVGGALLFLVFQNAQAPIKSDFAEFGRTYFLGLPNIWWPMVALILVAGYFLPRTRVGRRAIAVGGNAFAAQARGISLGKTRIAIFMVASTFVGLAGVLFASSNGPFVPAAGATFQLPVIAAVILSGVSLAGGRGSIWLILLSVGFLSTVPTSLVFFGLSSNWQAVFQGAILIVAVAIDGYRGKREAR